MSTRPRRSWPSTASPSPRGGVASTPDEARRVAESLGGRAVVKAQVHAGGRGKAGGIKLVASPEEAEAAAADLLGSTLFTYQTGPEGAPVDRVLVEEIADLQAELYLAVLVDGGAKCVSLIASQAGGVEIEEVAANAPEKILPRSRGPRYRPPALSGPASWPMAWTSNRSSSAPPPSSWSISTASSRSTTAPSRRSTPSPSPRTAASSPSTPS